MSKQVLKKIPNFNAYEIVNRFAMFEELTPEDKRLISNNQNIFYFIPNEDEFIIEGDIESCVYLLLSGSARVKHHHINYDELKPGDIVGINGFIHDIPRTASVIATADILAIKYSRFQFKKLPPHVREIIKDHMLEELSKRIDRLNMELHPE
ncbi:MAG: CRP/FNR family cyclic AMP-dependent transcriptional regulator [Alteromonadaceae bacterium]